MTTISLPVAGLNQITPYSKESVQKTASNDSFISRVALRILQNIELIVRIDRPLCAFCNTPSLSNAAKLGWNTLQITLIGSSIYAFGTLFTIGNILIGLTIVHIAKEYAKDHPFHSFSEYFPSNTALAHIALGMASFLITGPAISLLITGIKRSMEAGGISFTARQDVDDLLEQPGISGILWCLYGAIGAPILEEWLFRGILQDALSPPQQKSADPKKEPDKMSWEKMRAILKTSTIFGLMHASSGQGWFNIPVVAATTLMGICAGLLREATGDLWAPTALHATNNTLSILLSRLSV